MFSSEKSRVTDARFRKMCAANWFLHLYVFSMLPLLAAQGKALGAGPAVVGWAVMAFAFGMVLPGPLGASLMERRSRKGVFLRAMWFVGLIPTLGYAALSSVEWLVLLHGLQGMAFGVAQIALGTTLINDILPSCQRNRGDVRYAWAGRLGIPMGLLAGQVLVQYLPLAACWWWTLWPCLFAFLLVAQVEVPIKAPVKVPLFTLDRFFLPRSWHLSLTLFAAPWLLGRVVGTTHCTALELLLLTVGVVVAGLGRKIPRRHMSGLLPVVSAYGCLLLALFGQSLWGSLHSTLCPLLVGIGVGAVSSQHLAAWVHSAEHCQRGTAQSTYMLSWRMAFALGFATTACRFLPPGVTDAILCMACALACCLRILKFTVKK